MPTAGPQTRDELDHALAIVLAEILIRSLRLDLTREAAAGQTPAPSERSRLVRATPPRAA